MTSKPASRNARATSFAPRSCPSSPGFATSTRTGITLKHRRLLELAPLVLEHVDHLPHRAVRLHAVDEQRHEVLVVAPGGIAERGERRAYVGGRARPLHVREPFELAQPRLVVHLVALDLG